MLPNIKHTVCLPEHPDVEGERRCCMCGEGTMIPFIGDNIYGDIRVRNVHGWYCLDCGEELLTSDEAKLIEEALQEVDIS